MKPDFRLIQKLCSVSGTTCRKKVHQDLFRGGGCTTCLNARCTKYQAFDISPRRQNGSALMTLSRFQVCRSLVESALVKFELKPASSVVSENSVKTGELGVEVNIPVALV